MIIHDMEIFQRRENYINLFLNGYCDLFLKQKELCRKNYEKSTTRNFFGGVVLHARFSKP